MKIAVNARFLGKPYTGIGQYTKNLFKELAKIDIGNEYLLVVPEDVPDEVKSLFPGNVELKVLSERKRGPAGFRKTWWEQIQIPEFFKKEKVDIAFFPYASNPWSADWYKNGIKTVVTIHDCIPWKNKKYRRKLLSKMYHAQSKKAVNKADLVFTVSKTSKKDITQFCKVDEGKIKVVYNDAGDAYKEEVSESYAKSILEKYQLSEGRYFIYCGGYDERKNVDTLIKEYFMFVKDGEMIPLVLVGDKLFDNKLYSSFESYSQEAAGRLVQTGFVDDKTLAALYARSLAFVHLSEEEGFNIPLLEAANCGAPLILSDIEIHREIAGDMADFVDPDNEGEMAKMMANFSEKSGDLSEKYSWKKSAQMVKDMLSSL